ncbi:hypothetical protein [Paraburkholderia megapolitana]|uniref:Uncharacterized protein n=1 Tax=Paraburkholderia megapolitana TaxID=420953 RepID=A0A1I3UG11_9BURK|nr:hypothetical protein [Paraburkholderia megapolitana]QDQ83569.1 hypothetical protein FNZ07_20545 [Paraburkholderia megapolitana]SFJ80717.1 hypothetical protein SAMN05192543_111110 [Paraburkholderia megapolitana]
MPILVSAIENGTETGKANARRNLLKLACEIDRANRWNRRMQGALARLAKIWPKGDDMLDGDERAALTEAAEVLAIGAAADIRRKRRSGSTSLSGSSRRR